MEPLEPLESMESLESEIPPDVENFVPPETEMKYESKEDIPLKKFVKSSIRAEIKEDKKPLPSLQYSCVFCENENFAKFLELKNHLQGIFLSKVL